MRLFFQVHDCALLRKNRADESAVAVARVAAGVATATLQCKRLSLHGRKIRPLDGDEVNSPREAHQMVPISNDLEVFES